MNKVWLALTLTWIYCATTALSSVEAQQKTNAFARVRFNVDDDTTGSSYTKFIKAIRENMVSGSLFHDIPQLRDPATLTSAKQKFLLVELSTPSFDTAPLPIDAITLAVDQVNIKVLAYRAGGESYYFRDAPYDDLQGLFPRTKPSILPFNNNYADLERYASVDRSNISLGRKPLNLAIRALRDSNWDPNTIQLKKWDAATAASLIIVTQMLTEAARFNYVEQQVSKHFDTKQNFRPDAFMLSLEDSWIELSIRVQQSNQGVFDHPIQLRSASTDGTLVELGNVRDVIPDLALMMFLCKNQTSQNRISPLVIASVVGKINDGNGDACTTAEPTVSIIGREGLCVNVRDGKYNDGNPIQLWPCTGTSDNELWTIKRDGTIQSNGKCLTTYGYSPGSYVMIYNCQTAVADATRWKILEDGTIINPKSGLVLSAESGNSRTTLTVETNIYASRQAWLASKNFKPPVVSIVGFKDLCMQVNGPSMWLETCASSKEEQKWALYADSTIRPKQNKDQCLSSADESSGTLITISSCSSASAGLRWVFTAQGTIMNLKSKLVMDVKQSDPSLRQVITYGFTGNPNQKWSREL